MKTIRSRHGGGGFTLLELLLVIAIIAIVAAMLLPAVSKATARAKRVQCIDHLRQTGIGFQNFAHEHNGQFPMAVPASAGGTLELAQNSYRIPGEFYFSFRHLQALSNELVTPKLAICPSDTRDAASNFASLNNEHVSYFVAVSAEYSQPNSILAGDRNLTNDYAGPATIVRLGPNNALRWTRELHQFKGNLLMSDGRVEEKNNPGLAPTANQLPAVAAFALPTVKSSQTMTAPSGPATESSLPALPTVVSPAPNPASAPPPPTSPAPNNGSGVNSASQGVFVAQQAPAAMTEQRPPTPKSVKPAPNTSRLVSATNQTRAAEEPTPSAAAPLVATTTARPAPGTVLSLMLLLAVLILASTALQRRLGKRRR